LGAGWSRATPAQEKAITIRHLITMTSGLSDRGVFEHKPDTKWRYNTPIYARSVDVVVAVYRTGLLRNWVSERFLLVKLLNLEKSKGTERWELSQI
jgi:CubicO group peptidase (beta-lactamase class C family)